MTNNECALLIFSRAPVAGEVKTRLIPALSDTDAADLYKTLIKRTLQTARASGISTIQLWCTPTIAHPFFKSCVDDFNVELKLQEGSDLGERMAFAMSAALNRYRSVLLIGCDCPELTPSDLIKACNKIEQDYEMVIGPVEDGGYYLIGGKSSPKELFSGIHWGSTTVLNDTRERLKKFGLSWYELDKKWDLDLPEDLDRYRLMISNIRE